MLPGWCCIANRHIGARERRQLIPHVRFQVPFLGPESQLKSGFACAGLLCIVSPLDMSGMVGMAQTLAVYHYGYYTLEAGQVQSHESALVPSDTAAVLEWNLNVPFTSLDKPPFSRRSFI